jgi:hypothetical protein
MSIMHAQRQVRRRGASLVLLMIIIPVLLILTGFVIDLSRVFLVKSQLQAAADAGALAGAGLMRHGGTQPVAYSFSLGDGSLGDIRPAVQSVVAANSAAHLVPSGSKHLSVDANAGNTASGDIVLGYHADDTGFLPGTSGVNAVRVVARFAGGHANGGLPLLFGNLVSRDTTGLQATAVAKIERPTLLPFVVYQPQWDAMLAGFGNDHFTIDPATQAVSAGSDGIPEMTLFPVQWPGLEMPAGNYGWFDLGPSSSSATTLRRHIDEGPSTADMKHFGGELKAGQWVSGAPGLVASTQIAFTGGKAENTYAGIIGQPRVIALFDQASGQGTNATFRISQFVLGRVVAADLNGKTGVVVQPIPASDDANRVLLVQ